MKKFFNIVIICSLCLFVAGCEDGCDYTNKTEDAPETGKSTMEEMTFTEGNQQRMVKAVPPPKMKDSLERRNLKKYLEYWNNPNRLSYIYLMSRSGTVIVHYTIKGKVTYCSSKMTTRDQLVQSPFYENGAGVANLTSKIESPGLDGSYGPSEDASFFFPSENPDVPIQWKGDYLISGVPLNIMTKPVLVRTVK